MSDPVDPSAPRHGKVLLRASTDLPPCAVAVHPQCPYLIIFGTYKLEESTRTRHGTLEFWIRVQRDDEKESLRRVAELKTTDSSILDAQLHPANPNIVLTAQSTGEIIVWKFDDLAGWALEAREQLLASEDPVQIPEPQYTMSLFSVTDGERDVLVLSFSFSRVAPHTTLSATLTTGAVIVARIADDFSGIKVVRRITSAHSLEAWTSTFLHGSDQILFSGGDDAVLAAHDLRLCDQDDDDDDDGDSATVWRARNVHSAGVTSIFSFPPASADSPYQLWTGGYDDTLRCVDLRATAVQVAGAPLLPMPPVRGALLGEQNLGGGVWKLVPNPADARRFLVCCMYGGARVVDRLGTDDLAQAGEPAGVVGTLTEGHESMVYGGAWLDAETVVTCSFYDKSVQIWQ